MSSFELQHNSGLPRATIEASGIVSFWESRFPLRAEGAPLTIEVDDLRMVISEDKRFWGEVLLRKLECFSVFKTNEGSLLVARFARPNRQQYFLRLWGEPEPIHLIANRLGAGSPKQDLRQMAPVDAAAALRLVPPPAVGVMAAIGAVAALVVAFRAAWQGVQGQRADGVPLGATFGVFAMALLVFAAMQLRHSFAVRRSVEDAQRQFEIGGSSAGGAQGA